MTTDRNKLALDALNKWYTNDNRLDELALREHYKTIKASLTGQPVKYGDLSGINEAVAEMQACAVPEKRRVVAAACRAKDGTIFVGIRHFSPDMVKMFALAGYSGQMADCDQGFVDQWGCYLTRQEAFEIALRQGQYRPYPPYNFGTLYSEDLY